MLEANELFRDAVPRYTELLGKFGEEGANRRGLEIRFILFVITYE